MICRTGKAIRKDMMERNRFFQIQAWKELSWLVHGFGQAGFDLKHMKEEFVSFFPVEMRQKHSAGVIFLEGRPESDIEADGLVTATPGLLLVVKTADCLPVFLVDRVQKVVAAVHCGWRGTKEKILLRAVEMMREKAGADTHDIMAGFGPCIEQRCYEVGEEVYEQFREKGFRTEDVFRPAGNPGKFLLDLRRANFLLLVEETGIPETSIYQVEMCTRCRNNLHSYRRDKRNEARLYNFVGLTC